MKTIKEVAEFLRVSRQTVQSEIKRGALQAICIRSVFRISEKQLNEYIERQTTPLKVSRPN
ncbi:helix-turn-helix domain-containing protein [Niabella insulamsoli]|uniref:helix-turn-helix domain-containing protein n=1 Tax=Niabella insulamsoli TaxID=3144874 RepID=UPI0031FBA9A9